MAEESDYTLVKNVKANSSIWENFSLKKRKKDGIIDENVAVCRHCDSVIKRTGGGTTNMAAHIRQHHPTLNMSTSGSSKAKTTVSKSGDVEVILPVSSASNKQHTLHSLFESKTKYKPDSQKAKTITSKVARFIVKDLRPYRIVETSEFKDLVTELDPRYRLPSRKQFAEVIIPKIYNDVKADIIQQLELAFQVALTTDGWTSRATESYVTITATFIDVNWELVNFVLQTRPLPESHTAENIAEFIQQAMQEWKLPTCTGGTVPPIISDNAANMMKAGKVLGCTIHIGCLAHTLNLAVQKSLKIKSVSNLLARIRNIVSFFHRSTVATAILKSKAELLDLPNHKLKTDVCTRWNSAYEMLVRFLELQDAVVATLTSREMIHMKDKTLLNSITDMNLTLAHKLSVVLKPLKDITTMLCTESLPTVSVIMPLHFRLTTQILQSKEDDLPAIAEMKEVMKADLTQRYLDKTELLNMTSAIDPRFKQLPYLSDDQRFAVYTQVTEEAVRVASIVQASVRVKTEKPDSGTATLTSATATESEPPLPSLPTEDQSVSDAVVIDPAGAPIVKQESKSVLDDILGDVFITQVEPPKSFQELAQMEVIQYRSELPLSLTENPLQWWKERESKFPFLSKLARCLLCIPATSVPSERVFSTAGDILTAQRASLKAKHVDQLIFLRKNWK